MEDLLQRSGHSSAREMNTLIHAVNKIRISWNLELETESVLVLIDKPKNPKNCQVRLYTIL